MIFSRNSLSAAGLLDSTSGAVGSIPGALTTAGSLSFPKNSCPAIVYSYALFKRSLSF